MVRPKTEELHKHTLNLRKGDMEALATLYPRFSPSVVVRRIISNFIDQVSEVPENDLQLDDTDLSL